MRGIDHRSQVITTGEGLTQSRCACGWCRASFGLDKQGGTMDAMQLAQDAADVHEWEVSLGDA